MKTLRISFDLDFGPRAVRALLAVLLLFAAVPELASETQTLTTYYPAPSGVYAQMITTGSAYLARDGGKVGVGTTSPAAKLDVAGKVRIADGTQGAGNVLTSDANGVASWVAQPKPFGGGYCTVTSGSSVSGGVNPVTGTRTCPAGTTAKTYFSSGGIGNCSGQCVVWTCYMCF